MSKVILGTLIKNMTRGALIKQNEIDEIISYEKTNNEYLKIGNIENGLITGDIVYLKKIEDRYKKYCVKNNNLVITKTGFLPKIMVADIEEGRNLLASGNFFIIDFDLSLVDPFYIASLFNSDKGKILLSNVMVGEMLPSINITKFKNMEIDLPDLTEQNRIGQIYKDTLNKIKTLQNQLNQEIDKLSHIL